jgi:hypothetical protein
LRPWPPAGTGTTLDGPVNMRDRVRGRAGHAPGHGCPLQPYSLAERGKFRLAGS